MAVTDLSRLRTQIADRPRLGLNEGLGLGDGVLVHFRVIGTPVLAGSFYLYVNGTLQVEGVAYVLDYDLGLVTFTAAPAIGATVVATYQWATFTDEVLEDLLLTRSVEGAAARAISWILADVDLFMKYTYGQEGVDRSASRAGLQRLYDDLIGFDAPFALELADTPDREAVMEPFIEQSIEVLDDVQ
jgi:hypothetical protein